MIYNELVKVHKPFEKTFENRAEKGIDLWTDKPMELMGRKYPNMFFASVKPMKGYVGFYYMPIYCDPKIGTKLNPDLMKMLKGKSCFHIKTWSKELAGHITAALKLGMAGYKERGWI